MNDLRQQLARLLFTSFSLAILALALTGCGGGGGGGGDDDENAPVAPDQENRWDFLRFDEGIWG